MTDAVAAPATGWARRRRELVEDLRVVLPSWLAARALVAVAFALAVSLLDHWVPGGRTHQMQEGLLAWDGTFYRDIATVGYESLPPEALRFFPLYPVLGRALGFLLGGDESLALVLIANVGALAAAVVMRRVALHELGDEAAAERAVWLTALFPPAFVLVWAYGEALFLVLSLGAFLAARRGRYGWAAGFAFLAALTRPVGILLAAPIAIEALRTWRPSGAGERVARVVAVLAPAAGLATYLAWVGRTFGDPWLPFSVQTDLRGAGMNPLARLAQGLGDLVGVERFGDGLHVPFAIAFVVLLVVVFRRLPVSYGIYATLGVLVALTANNLNSLERYGLSTFPLLLALAAITAARRVEWLALALCGSGLVAMAALAWLGIYVP
jgi:hypothetical protein